MKGERGMIEGSIKAGEYDMPSGSSFKSWYIVESN